MAGQFCTSCGHILTMDAKFCENCGAVFGNAGSTLLEKLIDTAPAEPTSATATREAVVKHARLVVSAWVIPFNATLVFGSTMVAVFDFLSPRVALLPIAATVAVTGMLAALALRKFVAPSLPPGSTLRRALAPELGVHKSPVLITTGLLSALMVSGAAWSSAASANGGVIASKFDAARNAQMQLGLMQGLQKEQRVQTAVLEDIRDGRTLNPRRELANQGILWTRDAFHNAIRSDDLTVVSLFLAGGMKWNLRDATWAIDHGFEKIATQLMQHADLIDERSSSDCRNVVGKFDKPSKDTRGLPAPQQRPYELTSVDKKSLKFFCANDGDLKMVQLVLQETKSRHEASVASYKNEVAQMVTVTQCRQQLLGDGGHRLFQEGLQSSFPLTRGPTDREMLLSVVSNQLVSGGGMVLSPKVMTAVEQYCVVLGNRKPEMNFSDRSVQTMLQIVSALN